MNILEAIELAKTGKRIKRREGSKVYIWNNNQIEHAFSTFNGLSYVGTMLAQEDVMATDWEVTKQRV